MYREIIFLIIVEYEAQQRKVYPEERKYQFQFRNLL